MIIQHNIAALNSHRNMGLNNQYTNKNLEKLSSGYRINRAGDDAAGLAISEKMRGQIRGLAMAEQNTSNGINLIQTAEGALNETHAILQRMRELAVQSSNGTYDESVDRAQLEKEFQTIKSEIDRIAESTHYNGIKLLDGSLGMTDRLPVLSKIAVAGTMSGGAVTAGSASTSTLAQADLVGLEVGDVFEFIYTDKNGTDRTFSHTITSNDVIGGTATTRGADLIKALTEEFGADYSFTIAFEDDTAGTSVKASGALVLTARENGFQTIVGKSYSIYDAATKTQGTVKAATNVAGANDTMRITLDATNQKYLTIDGKKFQFVSDPSQLEAGCSAIYVDVANTITAATDMSSIVAQLKDYGYNVTNPSTTVLAFAAKSGKGLTFQIGANGGADQRVSLSVAAMDSKSIGITDSSGNMSTSLASASIATQDAANLAIEIITGATNMVSSTRADLGALQNRLEHTMNNLGVTKENLTASESTIRDVDMAKEMMDFTKNQILVQASQAMLAQANQLPQGVLNLLR